VNKCASGGVAQVRIIQLNYHFPTIVRLKFGVRIVQVCVVYSNFYGMSVTLHSQFRTGDFVGTEF